MPATPDKAQTIEEFLDRLKIFKETRQAQYGLTALGVFGSFARNQADAESDVDIAFETTAPNLFLTSRMRLELESLLARRVDVVRLRPQMNPRLRARILREVRYV